MGIKWEQRPKSKIELQHYGANCFLDQMQKELSEKLQRPRIYIHLYIYTFNFINAVYIYIHLIL